MNHTVNKTKNHSSIFILNKIQQSLLSFPTVSFWTCVHAHACEIKAILSELK